jgi:hypothetical protein
MQSFSTTNLTPSTKKMVGFRPSLLTTKKACIRTDQAWRGFCSACGVEQAGREKKEFTLSLHACKPYCFFGTPAVF